MLASDLDTIRAQVINEFDYWAANGLGEGVTSLQIDVHTYRKMGEQVRSLGKRDPEPAPQPSKRLWSKIDAPLKVY